MSMRGGLDWYQKLYAGQEMALARGEASNSYSATETFPPHTIDRIAKVIEAPKFLYIVRHPRDRTESDWMQRSKIENISFSDFLHSDTVYADKNQYLRTYERYADRFGKESLMVLFYDDLRSNRAALLSDVAKFLGVDPAFSFDTDTPAWAIRRSAPFFVRLGKAAQYAFVF